MTTESFDVVVVGGGIGGLATALDVTRRGLSVCVLEAGSRWGGRGASDALEGFTFNQGPHAIYPAAWSFLRALDLKLDAHLVASEGSMLDDGERLLPLPASLSSFLAADWLSAGDRLDLIRALLTITLPASTPHSAETLRMWLDARALRPNVRAIIEVLVRIATYGASPDVAAARPALANLRSVIVGGVRYADGGWQSIVDALTNALAQYGVSMQLRTRAMTLTRVENGFQIKSESAVFRAPHIVIAGSPQLASMLLGEAHTPPSGKSIAAACLELGLASLPEGTISSAFGIASPTYVSVHSKTARLAPQGQAMVHAALYLDDRAPNPSADRQQLEAALERAIPGWKSHVLAERFTPRMLVSHARVEAPNGLASRPSVVVPALSKDGVGGVYRVGDWIGAHGMLLDAVLSTSRIAARACAEGARKHPCVSSMSRTQHADA